MTTTRTRGTTTVADQPNLEELVVTQFKDVCVVTFHSARILDAAHVERIGEELYILIEKKDQRKIVLDFNEVKFLSSSMLGVLLNARGKIDRVEGQIVLCGLQPDLYKVFKITKLDKMFPFFDTEAKALASFGITGV